MGVMNRLIENIVGVAGLMSIIFIATGLYHMCRMPIGEATDNDKQMAKLYPIGVGLFILTAGLIEAVVAL